MRNRDPRPWDSRAYFRMTDVRVGDGVLHVMFEDGAVAAMPIGGILSDRHVGAVWGRMTWDPSDPYEIEVPTAGPDAKVVIPSHRLRLLSDPAYLAFWDEVTRRDMRRLGRRLATLRRDRRLTRTQVAAQAAISVDDLTQIERGIHAWPYGHERAILHAMGYTRDDMDRRRATRTHAPQKAATA